MATKVILDTNFLLIPAQFRVDIFSEIDRICVFSHVLAVVDRTVDELEHIIESQKGKNKAAAGLALKMLKANRVAILPSKNAMFKNVDKIIIEFASSERVVVATQDYKLRSELRKSGTRTIVLRSKKYLLLEEN